MSQSTTPQYTDPKGAKAQAKAEKAYRKASRPFYKKKRFILVGLILLIVIIVVATSMGGDDSSSDGSSSGSSQAAGLNTPARDGKFEFTVTGVDCSQNTLGTGAITTTANGVFCVVSVNVTNVGDEAQTLDATSQYGYDAAKNKYSTDTEAELYLPDSGGALFNQLNPGTSVTGQIVYDVPAGTQLTSLELHDSMFSDGVNVTLG